MEKYKHKTEFCPAAFDPSKERSFLQVRPYYEGLEILSKIVYCPYCGCWEDEGEYKGEK